jgi:hypothetical protein
MKGFQKTEKHTITNMIRALRPEPLDIAEFVGILSMISLDGVL